MLRFFLLFVFLQLSLFGINMLGVVQQHVVLPWTALLARIGSPADLRRLNRAELKSLAAELRGLHVHDHAEIARIRRDYGQRIREHMAQAKRSAED